MICAIHQPQYFPYLGYFEKIASCDTFVFLDDVQFKKNEWQNRNRIKTAEGTGYITVPVGYRFPQNINEVPIAYDRPWAKMQLRTFEENYGRAEFFEAYQPEIAQMIEKRWENLAALNIATVNYVVKFLGLKTKILLSSSMQVEGQSTERLVNICKAVGADTYLSGSGGKNYLDADLFEKGGIQLQFQDFPHPEYKQVSFKKNAGFVSNLSIVDLLFNHGPESFNILASSENR